MGIGSTDFGSLQHRDNEATLWFPATGSLPQGAYPSVACIYGVSISEKLPVVLGFGLVHHALSSRSALHIGRLEWMYMVRETFKPTSKESFIPTKI